MSNKFSYLFIAFLFFAILSNHVNAQVTQDQRERRRAMVGDLLKTLIEAQMQRDQFEPRPGRPYRGQLPHNPQPDLPLSADIISARAKCELWETESDGLVRLLRQEEQRLPKVRPLLADALSCNANIKSLNASLGRVDSLEPLTDPFCQIDSDWRLLNFQLSQFDGLSADCNACRKRMMSFDKDLCGLFEVQPQFNRQELGRYCTQMASHFQNLVRDIRYDMRGEPNYASIVRDCQRIYARLNEADRLVPHGTYASVAKLYKDCVGDWQKMKYKLAACPHDRIRRDVHQIENTGRHISELLWIPTEIDRAYLAQVLSGIDREVTQAFRHVSLQDVLACKTPGAILKCSREFQTQCGKLQTSLKGNADQEALLWEFQQFSNQWNDLEVHLASFKQPNVARSIVQIDSGFEVLQGTFGDGPLIDRATMAQICSDLDQLSYRLNDYVEINTARTYDAAFRDDICDCSQNFHQCIHQMHEHALADRRHTQHAIQDVQAAVVAWEKMRPLIAKCKPEHRRQLVNLRSRIEPLMVKLQVVFPG